MRNSAKLFLVQRERAKKERAPLLPPMSDSLATEREYPRHVQSPGASRLSGSLVLVDDEFNQDRCPRILSVAIRDRDSGCADGGRVSWLQDAVDVEIVEGKGTWECSSRSTRICTELGCCNRKSGSCTCSGSHRRGL